MYYMYSCKKSKDDQAHKLLKKEPRDTAWNNIEFISTYLRDVGHEFWHRILAAENVSKKIVPIFVYSTILKKV